jgi:hypothetical protein
MFPLTDITFQIVPDQSATIPGYDAIGIPSDYSEMTKFGGDDSLGYQRVLGELRRWVIKLYAKKPELASTATPAETSQRGTVTYQGNVTNGGVGLYGQQTFKNSGVTNFGGLHTVHKEGNGTNAEAR